MPIGELIGCLLCIFILSLATVICFKTAIVFQDNIRLVRLLIGVVWMFIADETGQGMVALSGAVKNHPRAEAELGLHYLTGTMPGTFKKWPLFWPKSPERGQYWLDKAAQSGNPAAEAILANAYVSGEMGLPRDPAKASVYLKKICESPSSDKDLRAEAAMNLAAMYTEGDGIPPNPGEAFRYLLVASDAGSGTAAHQIAKSYETGDVVPMDYAKAYIFYQRAVTNGDESATGDYYRLKQQLNQK